MNRKIRKSALLTVCIAGLAAVTTSLVSADPDKGTKQPAPGDMPLPPGWTTEDMQACMQAGTPGKMHEKLAKCAGVWTGKTKMWMSAEPGEPMVSDCTMNVTSIMDGRYIKEEMAGDMPGMGAYTGLGIVGFDNVSQKFVGSWIDNHGSGIMQGVGELSADGKTTTWNFSYNCPVTKKPTVMRQIQARPDDKTMSLTMFVTDPKSGKEYKCMHIDMARK